MGGMPPMATRNRFTRRAIVLLISVATMAGFLSATPVRAAILAPNPLQPVTLAVAESLRAVKELTAQAQGSQEQIQQIRQNIQTQVQTIVQNGQADPTTIAPALQALVTSQVGTLTTPALLLALSLASKVAGPVCPVVGAVAANTAANIPTMPDYSLFGPLAVPVKQVDNGASDALYNFYVNAIAQLLLPVDVGGLPIGPYVSLAQTLLGLLKIDWYSTYYPPGGGTPISRVTPAFLNLPMVLDVDQNVGIDICGNMGLDLTTLTVQQQIDRVPTANPTMALDLRSAFIGIVAAGYETQGSFIPSMFQTTSSLTQAPADTRLSRPGPTLTQLAGIQFHSNTTNAGNTLRTKTDLEIFNRIRTTNAPDAYYVTNANGLQTWYGKTRSTAFTNLNHSNGAIQLFSPPSATTPLLTIPVVSTAGYGATPAPAYMQYCTAATNICSNAPDAAKAVETTSLHVRASEVVKVDTYGLSTFNATPPITVCPADTHITTNFFNFGAKVPTASSTAGHAWADTDNYNANGCVAGSSTTTNMVIPAGFKAENRLGQWVGTGNPPALPKTGTITCPTGTVLKSSTAGSAVLFHEYLCPNPPTNPVGPTITGDQFQDQVLTVNPGTWAPASGPNAVTLTYQWLRCDAAGNNCAAIPGATNTTYLTTSADATKTLRAQVTGTNADGVLVKTTAPTQVIGNPPAPVALTQPVISGILGSGNLLSATNGTWQYNPTSFIYQWFRCDNAGANCAVVPGATANTFTPTHDEENGQVKVAVTATNIGGSTQRYSEGSTLPPHPANTALPVVRNGANPVTGNAVFQGQTLNVTNGTWTNAATFEYQWLACDPACTPIPGATNQTFKITPDQVAKTISARVTAKNANTDSATSADAAPTGTVVADALVSQDVKDVPDGNVFAAAATNNNTSLAGGNFDTAGPFAGNAGSLVGDPTLVGKTVTKQAKVGGGKVNATSPDGAGGYFIGGNFTRVGGAACNAVAHIKSDGTLDPAYCQAAGFTGEVKALDAVNRTYANASAGTTLAGCTTGTPCTYALLAVGGLFTQANGHKNLAFIAPDGSMTYAPTGDPDGAVNAIANDSAQNRTNFFVGGKFLNLGSVSAKRLGNINATVAPAGYTGTLTATQYFGGVDCSVCANPEVKAISFVITTSLFPNILVGGNFDQVFEVGNVTPFARSNAAAYAQRTPNGLVGGWAPNPNGPVNAFGNAASNASTAPVYIAGNFTTGGGLTGLKGLLEFAVTQSPSTASWLPVAGTSGVTSTSSPNTAWKPQVDNGEVLSVVFVSSTVNAEAVYVAGSFTSIDGQARGRLANLPAAGAAAPVLRPWNPQAGQTVRSITRTANGTAAGTLFTGGDFRVLGGQVRNNLAEFNADGTLTSNDGGGTNNTVNAIVVKGNIAYVGGTFGLANGSPRGRLAAFDYGSGGALTAWNPTADAGVFSLAPSANGVFAGGAFNNIGGLARSGVAELNASDGTAVPAFSADTDGPVYALAPDGATLYIGGAFTKIGISNRASVGAVNSTTGAITSWNPGATGGTGQVYALATNATGDVFVGGSFLTLGGVARNALGVVSNAGVTNATWDPAVNNGGTVASLSLINDKLFVGGLFSNIGGAARTNAAQLDGLVSSTGAATSFTPNPDSTINAFVSTSATGAIHMYGFQSISSGKDTQGLSVYGG